MPAYVYFPGCNIPYRERGYEISARWIAARLGVELIDMDFNCCGLNTENIDMEASLIYAARNLALAEEIGKDLIVLCNGCYKTLCIANEALKRDGGLRGKVNISLSKIGKKFTGKIRVIHFVDLISNGIKEEHITHPIPIKVATHAGCHALRPEYVSFGAAEKLDALVSLAGAESVDYLDKNNCCGGPLLAVSEEIASNIGRSKILQMKEGGAKLAITQCPFCQLMLDTMQIKMEESFGEKYNLPSLYVTQFLALAMGADRKKAGMGENKIDATKVLGAGNE